MTNYGKRGDAAANVSSLNSTTTPLGASETFTGEWEEVDGYSTMTVIVATDTICTLYVDFSTDGTNIDRAVQLSGGDEVLSATIHSLTIVAKYMRVRLINSTTPQTYLRIQAMTSITSKIAVPTSRLGQNVGQWSDVLNTRVSNDIALDTSRGVIGGRSVVNVNGRNTAVTTSPVVCCSTETAYTGFLTSAATVRVKSGGNANDTAAGSGAREITIYGLDANFNEVSEAVATAGTSASSSTTTQFIRIFKAAVTQCGTYSDGLTGSNTGVVSIETTAGTLMTAIRAGLGESQCGVYTIPAGKTGYIVKIAATVESSKPADIIFFKRLNANDSSAPVKARKAIHTIAGLSGISHDWLDVYYEVPEKTDVWSVVNAISGGANTSVATEIDIILIDNQ